MGGVGGIACDGVVVVDLHAQTLQPGLEGLGSRLGIEPGQHHAGHIQPQFPENVDEPDHIPVIGDA